MASQDRLELALRHVLSGRQVIAAQRALIISLRKKGRPTDTAEGLLADLERRLRTFEDNYERLVEAQNPN